MDSEVEVLADLRLLYQIAASDITLFKNRQVSITNYTVAIYSALIVIDYQFLKGDPLWQDVLTSLLALAVFVASFFSISDLHRSIEARRERMAKCRETFSSEFQNAWEVNKSRDIFRYYFYAVNFVGLVLVVWLAFA